MLVILAASLNLITHEPIFHEKPNQQYPIDVGTTAARYLTYWKLFSALHAQAGFETVFVTDTLMQVDTIIHTVTQLVTIDRPVPVYIDTSTNIRTYRDTIIHPYGTINREELVLGEILKQDLHIDFKIPETLRTMTVTNTTSQTIRSQLLFVTGGFRHKPSDLSIVPTVGLIGVVPGHKLIMEINMGLDGTFSVDLCVTLFQDKTSF